MPSLRVVFLILALVCFLLSAIGWPAPPQPPKLNLIGAGLFFATLAWLTQ